MHPLPFPPRCSNHLTSLHTKSNACHVTISSNQQAGFWIGFYELNTHFIQNSRAHKEFWFRYGLPFEPTSNPAAALTPASSSGRDTPSLLPNCFDLWRWMRTAQFTNPSEIRKEKHELHTQQLTFEIMDTKKPEKKKFLKKTTFSFHFWSDK